MRQAAVLVGAPAALLDVGGRPFLAWVLRELCRWRIEEVVLLAAQAAPIHAALPGLAATLPRPLRIRVSEAPEGAGSGGALLHARGLLAPRFLLLRGDCLLDANLAPHLGADPPGTLGRMVLRRLPDAGRHGVDAGMAVLDRALVDSLSDECSLERDVLPGLARSGRLLGRVAAGWFVDVGGAEGLARARAALPARLRRPALFLDRDGVLNRDHGWVGSRERWEWMPGAIEAVRDATEAGWHVMVATNQSGVARGLYSEADVESLHAWMADTLMAAGGTVDDLRYCPFHPKAVVPAYRRASACRKPEPGMLLEMIAAWGLDPGSCHMVGDSARDIAAAQAAGMAGHLFTGGDLRTLVRPILAGAAVRPLAGGEGPSLPK